MEQALYIHDPQGLRYLTEDFTRLYFGAEFCERLLPAAGDLAQAISHAEGSGLAFTFMTPFVTNQGLERLEILIALVSGRMPEAEIVVNDWGVLHLLRSQYPRIMNIIDKIPAASKEYYRGSNLDVPAAAEFLRAQGIERVEFDNLLQGLCLDTADPSIHRSLYLPYAFVSATRFCLTANCDQPDKMGAIGVFPCGRQCLDYTFNLHNPVMGRPLIRRGNAVFFINETIPDIVTRHQVDRIVVQPELPV